MAFETVGVEAIISGMGAFRSNADDFNKRIQGMSTTASGASGGTGILSGALGTLGSALGNVLQIAGGILVTQVFNRIASAVTDMAGQALSAAAQFQVLQIQLQGLIALQIADQMATTTTTFQTMAGAVEQDTEKLAIATDQVSKLHSEMEILGRHISDNLIPKYGASSAEVNLAEIKMRGYQRALLDAEGDVTKFTGQQGELTTVTKTVTTGVGDMKAAMEQARQPAKDLLQWIVDFAIKTPFTVLQLTEMSRGFLSIGMGIPETERLTAALGSLGAGLGLTTPFMDRLVANILQTSRSMKITERDIREFGNAGLPVNRVLDKMARQLGITRLAALEFAKSGEEGVKAFIAGIVDVAEEDFPDALDNMSRTWAVAASNITDLIQSVFGKEVLGPIVGEFAGMISDMINTVLEMRPTFTEIGLKIEGTFKLAKLALEPFFKSIGKLVEAVMTLLGIDTSGWNLDDAFLGIDNVMLGLVDKLTKFTDWLTKVIESPTATAIIDSVRGAFEALGTFWDEHGDAIVAGLKDIGLQLAGVAAEGVAGALKLAFEWIKDNGQTIEDGVKGIAAWVKDTLVPALRDLGTWVSDHRDAVIGFFLVLGAAQIVSGVWGLVGAITALGIALWPLLLIAVLTGWFIDFGASLAPANVQLSTTNELILGFSMALLRAITAAGELLAIPFLLLVLWVRDILDRLVGAAFIWGEVIKGAWESIKTIIATKAGEIKTAIESVHVPAWVKAIVAQVGKFTTAGENLISGVVKGIVNKAGEVITAITKAITDAIGAAKRLISAWSPSRLTARTIGEPMITGIIKGITAQSSRLSSALSDAVMGSIESISPTMQFVGVGAARSAFPMPAPASSSRSSTVNNSFDVVANYSQTQSPVSLRHDLEALLVTTG